MHANTLRWWRTEIRRARRNVDSGVRIVPVVPARHIEIAITGAVLRVEEGTDVAYVAAIVRAMGGAC